jgi:hypothetical protein
MPVAAVEWLVQTGAVIGSTAASDGPPDRLESALPNRWRRRSLLAKHESMLLCLRNYDAENL